MQEVFVSIADKLINKLAWSFKRCFQCELSIYPLNTCLPVKGFPLNILPPFGRCEKEMEYKSKNYCIVDIRLSQYSTQYRS